MKSEAFAFLVTISIVMVEPLIGYVAVPGLCLFLLWHERFDDAN